MKETAEERAAKDRSAAFEFAALKPRSRTDRYALPSRCSTCGNELALKATLDGKTQCWRCVEHEVEAARKSRTLEDVVRENCGVIDLMTPSELLAAISNALEELK